MRSKEDPRSQRKLPSVLVVASGSRANAASGPSSKPARRLASVPEDRFTNTLEDAGAYERWRDPGYDWRDDWQNEDGYGLDEDDEHEHEHEASLNVEDEFAFEGRRVQAEGETDENGRVWVDGEWVSPEDLAAASDWYDQNGWGDKTYIPRDPQAPLSYRGSRQAQGDPADPAAGSWQERYATIERLRAHRHFADGNDLLDGDLQEVPQGVGDNIDVGPAPASEVQVPNPRAGQDLVRDIGAYGERVPRNLLEAAQMTAAEEGHGQCTQCGQSTEVNDQSICRKCWYDAARGGQPFDPGAAGQRTAEISEAPRLSGGYSDFGEDDEEEPPRRPRRRMREDEHDQLDDSWNQPPEY